MKTSTLLMAAMVIIFASCKTNKTLTREQLVSSIEPTDKVGIITLTVSEHHPKKGAAVVGTNSYYYTVPDTAHAKPSGKNGSKKAKPKKVLVMDTLMRMVESKYSNYIGTQLVPAKVGTKIPTARLDGGIPCLPHQTIKQAIKTTDLDKLIEVTVGWGVKGGFTLLGISMGTKKPTAIIITKVYDRSGEKIWERTQKFDSGIKIKNRGFAGIGGKDGMTGNQLMNVMTRAFDATFIEATPKYKSRSNQIVHSKP